MHKVDVFAAYINESIKSFLKEEKYQKIQYNGVTRLIVLDPKKNSELVPAVCSPSGECKGITPDDRYPMVMYHRVNDTKVEKAPNQYGDGVKSLKRSFNMGLIVFGQANQLKLDPDQVELLLLSSFPTDAKKQWQTDNKINAFELQITGSNFDSYAIFAREYKGAQYNLKPQHFLFEVKYRIECVFRKDCITTCFC